MKRRKKNKKLNPRYWFLVLLVVCCLLIGVSYVYDGTNRVVAQTIGTVLTPMQKGLNSIGYTVSSLIADAKTIAELQEENEALSLEVDTLKSELSALESDLDEMEALRELLELENSYSGYTMIAATIIAGDSDNWYDTFTIDKGSADGIEVDMNVIADDGLVGIVIETGTNHAIVRSIMDDSSSVSAMDVTTEDLCIVNGNLEQTDSGLLEVELIKEDATISVGSEIVTSYLSDKFLPDLTIGYVTSVSEDSTSLTKTALVTPVVDFEHLRYVLVITTLKSDLTDD